MSYRSIFQVWLIIAISGFIGLAAMGWNDSEKGSPIYIIKTQVDQVRGVKK